MQYLLRSALYKDVSLEQTKSSGQNTHRKVENLTMRAAIAQ